jgi:Ca2+-binding EF-hand superfamily protein
MFEKYDADGSGALSGEEVSAMLTDMWTGDVETLSVAKKLIDDADEDGDGEIEWIEFLGIMQTVFQTKVRFRPKV